MRKSTQTSIILFLLSLFVFQAVSFGMDAKMLKQMLDGREKLTVIDIRSRELYKISHIPGAISIPASIIARKKLPPIGKAVVYGDGVRQDMTIKAVSDLNAKPGIDAFFLEGGFPAWDGQNFSAGKLPGMMQQHFRYITYEQLKKASAQNDDMVLVDVRPVTVGKTKIRNINADSENHKGSLLSEKFPGMKIITLRERAQKKQNDGKAFSIAAISRQGKEVYVIIDAGDGTAEKVAGRLYGAGIRQVVILAGGERALRSEGRTYSRTIKTEDTF